MNFNYNRPLSFISLSHSDNKSESATKFYSSLKADVGGGGGRADTDLERTEIWPGWIILDAHRLRKISG